MAHAAQQDFFLRLQGQRPEFFFNTRVLDCGSLDVNGSLKGLFTNCDYVGVDLRRGRNVDLVAPVHTLPDLFPPAYFQTVVSAEMLEHDEFWQASLKAMFRALAPGGLLALSYAGPGRPEHGTSRVPDACGEGGYGVWGSSPDYYRPLGPDAIWEVLAQEHFLEWHVEENFDAKDVYVWGVKAYSL